jgi:hypothetical protein
MAGDRVAWLDESHLTSSGALFALPDLGPALTALAAQPVPASSSGATP